MTPTLDALVRQLREATDAALVPPHPKQALANEWKPHMTVNPHDMATLLDALTAAQTQRTSPITRLHNLVDGLSYCDDCAAPACDDDKPEGPHILCHDCAVKHKQAEAEAARLRERVQDYQNTVTQRDEIIADLHTHVSALQGELAEAQSDRKALVEHSDAAAKDYAAMRAERDAAREALRQAIAAAYCDVPVPGHGGACGPESSCDGICAESASRLAQIREWKAALGQPAEQKET